MVKTKTFNSGLQLIVSENDSPMIVFGLMVKVGSFNEVKEFEGDLISFDENNLVIDVVVKTKKKQVTIERKQVAKIRLAIKF